MRCDQIHIDWRATVEKKITFVKGTGTFQCSYNHILIQWVKSLLDHQIWIIKFDDNLHDY